MKTHFKKCVSTVFFSVVMFISQTCFAQNSTIVDKQVGNTSSTVLPNDTSINEAYMEGTYEIISQSKVIELFTTETLKEIEKRRDDTKEILYELSQFTTIKIYPRSVINAPGFVRKKQDEQ